MCDTELLIKAIRKHPCLWDVGLKDYHNREIKDLAWEEVCTEVYEGRWEIASQDEKSRKYIETKKKWNNVRDCYRRDLVKMKANPAKGQKKYIYANLLSFLTPMFKIKDTSGLEESNCSDEDDNNSMCETKEIIEDPLLQLKQENTTSTLVTTTSNYLQNKQTDTKDLPYRTMKIIKSTEKPTDEDDDDVKFLLSFRSDMKTMNKRQKLDFKVGMLQLLKTVYNYTDDGSEDTNNVQSEWIYVNTGG